MIHLFLRAPESPETSVGITGHSLICKLQRMLGNVGFARILPICVLFLKCNETFANTRIVSIRFVLKIHRNVPNDKVSTHATFVFVFNKPNKGCTHPNIFLFVGFVTYLKRCILMRNIQKFPRILSLVGL